MKKNTIANKDCLKYLKTIPDNSVDLVLTDPPYNIGKNFGNNNDNMDINEYVKWSKKWISACSHIEIGKHFKWADVVQDESFISQALDGSNMAKLSGNWLLEKRESLAVRLANRHQFVASIFQKVGSKKIKIFRKSKICRHS